MAACAGKKADGSACKGTALPGAIYCWGHDPRQAAARATNARKGGHTGGQGRPSPAAGELATIKKLLQGLVSAVYAGKTERAVAITMNLLLNTQLRVVEIERKLRETEDLEARLVALEAAQGDKQRWG